MNPDADALRRAIATIPGLAKLNIPVDRLLSQEEFEPMLTQFMADLDREVNMEYDFSAPTISTDHAASASGTPAPPPVSSPSPSPRPVSYRSSKISLRVPSPILAAIRTKAASKRVGYQTFINRLIREAAYRAEPLA